MAPQKKSSEKQVKKKPSTKVVKTAVKRPRKKVVRPPTVNVSKLKRYKKYLLTASKLDDQDDQREIFQRMKNSEFDTMCDCVHDLLLNESVLSQYFNDGEKGELKNLLLPWKKDLGDFTNRTNSRRNRKKLLGKNQKGGSAILAAIIGSLIPMAVQAIEKWVLPSKK